MDEAGLEKAERYLHNEMTPEERREFELQLPADGEMNRFIKMYKDIDDTMKTGAVSPAENELRHTLQQMGKKYFISRAKLRQGSFGKWWAVAAAAVILVCFVVYYLVPARSSAAELYAQFAKHEPVSIQLRGTTEDSLARLAAQKFNEKKYTEALPLFQQYTTARPGDIQMKFSEAICYMELDRYDTADAIFDSIELGHSAYADAARWYRALVALKRNDIGRCRRIVNSIPAASSYYIQAQELKAKLPN